MNYREFKCSTILSEMIDNYGLVGIKISFEDEGASFDEELPAIVEYYKNNFIW